MRNQRTAEQIRDDEAKAAAWNKELDTAIDTTLDSIELAYTKSMDTKAPIACSKNSKVFKGVISKIQAKGYIVSNRYLSGAYIDALEGYWACWDRTADLVIPYGLEPVLEVVNAVVEDYDKMRRWPRFLKKKRLPYAIDVCIPRSLLIKDGRKRGLSYKVEQAAEVMLKRSDLRVFGYIPAFADKDGSAPSDRFILYIGVDDLLSKNERRFLHGFDCGTMEIKAEGEPYKFTCEGDLGPMRHWSK